MFIFFCLKAWPPFTETVFFYLAAILFASGTPGVLSTKKYDLSIDMVGKEKSANFHVLINYSFNKLKYIHYIYFYVTMYIM